MSNSLKGDARPYDVCLLGHLGLVGAFIRESGIIEMIDSRIPKTSNNQIIMDTLPMVRLLP